MPSIYQLMLESPPPFRPVLLGYDDRGEPIELTHDDFYHHLHILGLSGRGKSRAIEYILRQFLLNGVGFTLLDPHGDIYDALLEWITWMEGQGAGFLRDRTVHLFDPADPEYAPGYNPLAVRPGGSIDARVDRFMDAVAEMLGGEDPDRMPLYQLIFSAVMYALAEKGLTAYETMLVLPESERALHEWLARDIRNQAHAQVWKDIRSWKPQEYRELVASFYRRMHRLFRNPVAARIFGQTENVLDTLEVMDQGQVLLANLKPDEERGFSEMTSKLVGKLLVNDFQQTARNSRPANKARPHVLLIDECPDYLSGDVPRILDGTRKYGLHLVLCHQRLEQLLEAGENIAGGVMAGAQTKLFFGSTYKTGSMIADEIFGSTYDLEKWKESSKRPSVMGYQVARRLGGGQALAAQKGRTVTEGEGYAHGRTKAEMEGEGEADGENSFEAMGGGEGIAHGTFAAAGLATGISYDYNQDPYFQIWPDAAHTSRVASEQGGASDVHSEHSDWSRGSGRSRVENRFRATSDAETEIESRYRALALQEATTKTDSATWQEVLEPIIGWFHTATFSVEEQRHEAAVEVQALARQRAFLKRPMSRELVSATVVSFDRPLVAPDPVRRQARLLKASTGINSPVPEVERTMAARWAALQRVTGGTLIRPSGEYGGRVGVAPAADLRTVDVGREVATTLRRHGLEPAEKRRTPPEEPDDDLYTSRGWLG